MKKEVRCKCPPSIFQAEGPPPPPPLVHPPVTKRQCVIPRCAADGPQTNGKIERYQKKIQCRTSQGRGRDEGSQGRRASRDALQEGTISTAKRGKPQEHEKRNTYARPRPAASAPKGVGAPARGQRTKLK